MKTVILSLNSKYIHSALAPWYLKAAAEELCPNADITVLESTINRTLEDTYSDLLEFSPRLLACSCYIWNIEKTLQIAKRYKQETPESYIVLGGPEVSYRAEAVLREYPFVDAVISGEGEKPFSELYNMLSKGETVDNIEGVSHKTDNNLHISQPYITTADPPSPYCEEFFKQLKGRIVYIEGSRGCPYSCAFCLSGRCGTVRYFGLPRVENDILLLANSGAKTVKFVDRTFNANRQRALEIWSFIIDNRGKLFPEDVCFHFEIAGDLLDEAAFKLLETAPVGLIQVEIGLQSFNEKTLTHINRKTNCDRLYKNIKELIKRTKIHVHIDLIAGLPFEDMKSFEDSFNKAFSLNADNLQLGFLKLLYGAPMRENRELYPCEFTPQPPYEITETPWLTPSEISALKNTEDALERIYNSGRFSRTVGYLTDQLKMNPFRLFYDVGNRIGKVENISLNEYIVKLFDTLLMCDETDRERLRDLLVADKLMTDTSGYIPEALRLSDPRLKTCRAYFRKCFGDTAQRIGVGIMYTADTPYAYGVNYAKKNDLGGYETLTLPLANVSKL